MYFFRNLLAVPLRLLAIVAGYIPVIDLGSVLHWILKITDQSNDGLSYLAYGLSRFGYKEMEPLAQKLMERYRDARFADIMGTKAYYEKKKDAAAEWIVAAEYAECENMEVLLGLKYLLCEEKQKEKQKQIIDEIVSRRDLPMALSMQAYPIKCYHLMLERNWGQAREIAGKILQIVDNSFAHLAYYGWHITNGREEAAFAELGEAQKHWNMGPFEHIAAQICYLAGDIPRACEYLAMAIDAGFEPVNSGQEWKALAESDEFIDYMNGRDK